MRVIFAVLWGSVVLGCTNPVSDCATTCMGCCDTMGACQAGSSTSACGVSGAQCTPCGPTQQCALGTCGDASAGGPDAGADAGVLLDGGALCTSGRFWTLGPQTGSNLMTPGEPCLACHQTTGAPIFLFAGTVYPSLHEADDCSAMPPTGTTVEIVDPASGVTLATMAVNAAGNFLSRASVSGPWLARVNANGLSVNSVTPQTNGDCNTCHTVAGINGAAGRIIGP